MGLVLSGFFSMVGYAEQIDFQGRISEFSCAENSHTADCRAIQGTVADIRDMKTPDAVKLVQLLNGHNEIATLKLENLQTSLHQVLVINYH
ncbi:hypothetical protein [Acinetobacter sp. WZC-1]|uniref:hypothetical protein n=1 Tax=Acinetobacter sp. WZC-1 TaxID=3459034 RepID=UPI00403DD07F